jgi:hypothetical protein
MSIEKVCTISGVAFLYKIRMIPSEKIEKPMARGRVIVQSKRMAMLAKFAVASFGGCFLKTGVVIILQINNR